MKPDNDLSVLAGRITPTRRLVLLDQAYLIASRRVRIRTRDDLRHFGLMYSEGHGLTPLGIELRNHLLDEDSRHG